jgi:hypothetical protein
MRRCTGLAQAKFALLVRPAPQVGAWMGSTCSGLGSLVFTAYLRWQNPKRKDGKTISFEHVAVTKTGQTIKIQTPGVRRVNNFVSN